MYYIFVLVAVLLAIVGNIPYLRDTYRGIVKPHPYTWFVSSIVSCVVVFGMISKGAGIGAIPVIVSEFFTIVIFLFSLKYGWKKITSQDKFFLLLSILSLLPWIYTKDPTISVILVVAIDLFSLAPSIRKTYQNPKTENPLLYGSNILRHILTLLTLSNYNIATTLHSLAMIISNTVFVFIIAWRKRKS